MNSNFQRKRIFVRRKNNFTTFEAIYVIYIRRRLDLVIFFSQNFCFQLRRSGKQKYLLKILLDLFLCKTKGDLNDACMPESKKKIIIKLIIIIIKN